MTCLRVSLGGIPDQHVQLVIQAIATQARDIVDHLDVFSGERYIIRRGSVLHSAGAAHGTNEGHMSVAITGLPSELSASVSAPVDCSSEKRHRCSTPSMSVPELYVRETSHTIVLKIRAQYLTSIIKLAKMLGVGDEFGSIDVADVRCTTEKLPTRKVTLPSNGNCVQRVLNKIRRFNASALDRMSTLEIHASIVVNSLLSFNHVACIVIASGMAAIGLLTDSSGFVLAAFFVSPLMQMILAVVWGFTVWDVNLTLRGIRNMLFGATVTLLNGFIWGFLVSLIADEQSLSKPLTDKTTFITINTQQITSRGPPAGNVVVSALIAALSGVAIALGQGSGISSALTGVCISTSLLPPLVNAGMMWSLQLAFKKLKTHQGYTLTEVGLYSIFLYLANIVCIIIFAWAAFKFKHIGGRTLRPMLRSNGLSLEADNDLDPAVMATEVLCAFSPVHSIRPSTYPEAFRLDEFTRNCSVTPAERSCSAASLLPSSVG